jgi:hypothetical protein
MLKILPGVTACNTLGKFSFPKMVMRVLRDITYSSHQRIGSAGDEFVAKFHG